MRPSILDPHCYRMNIIGSCWRPHLPLRTYCKQLSQILSLYFVLKFLLWPALLSTPVGMYLSQCILSAICHFNFTLLYLHFLPFPMFAEPTLNYKPYLCWYDERHWIRGVTHVSKWVFGQLDPSFPSCLWEKHGEWNKNKSLLRVVTATQLTGKMEYTINITISMRWHALQWYWFDKP